VIPGWQKYRGTNVDQLFADNDGNRAIRLSEMFEADGSSMFASAVELGLEGIIAKRLYKTGKGGEWRGAQW
jgi:ATP-dependent DNA ligase